MCRILLEVTPDFYIQNKDYFTNNGIGYNILHDLGWGLIKILKSLVDACQGLYNYCFSLIDITEWDVFTTYIDSFSELLPALLAVSLMALGFMLMHKNDNQKINIIQSIMFYGLIILSGNAAIIMMNDVVTLGKDAIIGDMTNTSNEIIASNIFDLYYIDQQLGLANMDGTTPPHYPEMTDFDVDSISINEVTNTDSSHWTTSEASDIASNQLQYVYGGASETVGVYNGFGWNSEDDADWFNEFYYRYTVNYLPCIISLVALGVVFVMVSYKAVRIIWEIVNSRLLAYLYSTDFTSSQKVVRILVCIRDSYITLLLTALTIKIFVLFQSYLSDKGGNAIMQGMALLFLAFCTVDGPNIIQQITGIDAGLSSGFAKMAAVYQAARTGTGMVKNTALAPYRIGRGISDFRLRRNMNKAFGGGKKQNGKSVAGEDSGTNKSGLNGDSSKASENMKNMEGKDSGMDMDSSKASQSIKSADEKMKSDNDIKLNPNERDAEGKDNSRLNKDVDSNNINQSASELDANLDKNDELNGFTPEGVGNSNAKNFANMEQAINRDMGVNGNKNHTPNPVKESIYNGKFGSGREQSSKGTMEKAVNAKMAENKKFAQKQWEAPVFTQVRNSNLPNIQGNGVGSQMKSTQFGGNQSNLKPSVGPTISNALVSSGTRVQNVFESHNTNLPNRATESAMKMDAKIERNSNLNQK